MSRHALASLLVTAGFRLATDVTGAGNTLGSRSPRRAGGGRVVRGGGRGAQWKVLGLGRIIITTFLSE